MIILSFVTRKKGNQFYEIIMHPFQKFHNSIHPNYFERTFETVIYCIILHPIFSYYYNKICISNI